MPEPTFSKPPLALALLFAVGWGVAYFVLNAHTAVVVGLAVAFIASAAASFLLGRGGTISDQPIYTNEWGAAAGEPNPAAGKDAQRAARAQARRDKKQAAQETKLAKKAHKKAGESAGYGYGEPENGEWLQQLRAPAPGGSPYPIDTPGQATQGEATGKWLDAIYDDDSFMAALNTAISPEHPEPELAHERAPQPEPAAAEPAGETAPGTVSWLDDAPALAPLSAFAPTQADLEVSAQDEELPVAQVESDPSESLPDAAEEADLQPEILTELTVEPQPNDEEEDRDVAETDEGPALAAETQEQAGAETVVAVEPKDEQLRGEPVETVEDSEAPAEVEAETQVDEAPAETTDDTSAEDRGQPRLAVPGSYPPPEDVPPAPQPSGASIVAVESGELAQPVLVSDPRVASVANQIAVLVAEAEWVLEQKYRKEIEAVRADAERRVQQAEEDAEARIDAAKQESEAKVQVVEQEAHLHVQQAMKQITELRAQAEAEKAALAERHEAELAGKVDKIQLDALAEHSDMLSESLEEAERNLQQVIDANRTVADAAATSAKLQAVAKIRRLRLDLGSAGVDAETLKLLDAVVDDFRG